MKKKKKPEMKKEKDRANTRDDPETAFSDVPEESDIGRPRR